MIEIENIRPESIHAEFGNLYVHAKKVLNPECLLYISGQVGVDKDGNFGRDCKEQLEIAWANVDAILAEAAMSRADIVEVFVFINGAQRHDVEENKGLYAESVSQYFGENLPVMSALVSAGLWVDDLCFEFKLTVAK